ncbi:SCO family protein [Phenylobacterium sp.]|uniref:SCO family protein n=1 Tax=Phenylobacterium sp. TaxID=1871053 RepID=UPI0035B118E6
MRTRSAIFLALGVAAAVTLAVLFARSGGFAPPGSGAGAVGGPFQMVDQNGRRVDEGVLKGKWSAVFFGYTYCPDVCPQTLQALAAAEDQLGPKGRDFQVVFVTVDPKRDTPDQLKAYLSADSFPRGAIGLTGTAEQTAAIAKAYHVFYEASGEGDSYVVSHSTPTYLMDPKGRFNRVIPYNLPPDEVARQIAKAMRAG